MPKDSESSESLLGWNSSSKETRRMRAAMISLSIPWKTIAIIVLATWTLVLSIVVLAQHAKLKSLSINYVDTGLNRWTQYSWWSKYSSMLPNEQPAVEALWDNILPAHGIVAVEHRWAAERRLPATISLPSDPSKGVYIIDAYHQMHCLTIIRKTFYQLSANEPLTYGLGHPMHCFDSLRQYIMCTAGDTLLYSWGRNITGDGQLRKCRDWSALRDWATHNSACYRDFASPAPLLDHFGHCDDGSDGLL